MSEAVPGIELEKLAPWFSEHVDPVDSLSAKVVGHGRSNLTYRVEAPDGRAWVLRRPPLSHVQPTAHDMSREFRVISALAPTKVPVPKTYALCDDTSIIGAPFYVMQFVEGIVPVDPNAFGQKVSETQRRALGEELIDTLAELHMINPPSVGLGDFGKPNGYIERQVRRFSEQFDRVKTRDLPELDELKSRLNASIPKERAAAIVHGDYRLDNSVVSDDGRVAAVLDWEMSTLGDPLADVGILRMYWRDRDSDDRLVASVGNQGVITLPGFPTFQEAFERYAKKTGTDLSGLDFYIVLAHFKLAVILENMHARFMAGGTVGGGFEAIGAQVLVLARSGLMVANASSIPTLPAIVNGPAIESVELRTYRLPLDPPFPVYWDPEPRRWLQATIVAVRAGEYEGVGSGDSMAGFEGNEKLFVGLDPFDIERHTKVIDNLQFHYGRMRPLEVALWDLMGKVRGEPLWRMLGGESSRVRVYASTGALVPADDRIASALRLRDEGFPAIKLRFFVEDDPADAIAQVRAVREAVGGDCELLVDANQGWRMPHDVASSWTLETALPVARALAELGVYWLEEPLYRHDYEGLAELRRRAGLRIAGGEAARDPAELHGYLRHGSLDVYQPDVAWSSGVAGARSIAKAAAAVGAMYTPHTWGDGLVLLANLHVAAAWSNAPFVEYAYNPPWWTPERRDFVLPAPLIAAGGWVELSDAPGLGFTIDWPALQDWRVA